MHLPDRIFGRQLSCAVCCQWSVLILLIISVLWRGGKSIDVTWILTGVAAFVTIGAHTKHRDVGNRTVPLLLWLSVFVFFFLTLVSYIYSKTQNYGFDELLRTGALGVLLLWSVRQAQGESDEDSFVQNLVRVLSILTVAACVIGLLVYVFQPVNRFVGTFFDYRFHTDYWPNAWAQYLLLTWPTVLFWVLRDYSKQQKTAKSRMEFLVRTGICGFVLGCLLLAYSRGAFLVLIAQLLLWAFIVFRKTRPHFPVRHIIPSAVALVAIASATFFVANTLRANWYEVQEVGEKITLQAAEGSSSVTERFQFWSQALTLSLQEPLAGWGPYSFRFIQPQLQTGVLATSDHPHNVILKILVERGVLSAIIFVFLIGGVLYRATREVLSDKTEVDSARFSLQMLLYIGIFGVLLHNMIDFNLQFIGIALPFWLLLGVLVTHLHIDELPSVPLHIARGAEVLLSIFLLLIALYEGSYLVVSSFGRHAEAVGDTENALLWYGRARGEYFTRDLYLSKAKLLYEDSMYEEAAEAVEAYKSRNNEDYRAWKREGDIALLRGEKQLALEVYTKALERAKYNDLGVVRGLMETYIALDQQNDLEKQLPMIEDLLQQYSTAFEQNAHYIALSPNVEQFIVICNMLARLYPDAAPKYQVMAAKADHHAQIERERISARPPGFLW